MIIGNREESVEEKRKRHIKETIEDKKGWQSELEYALKKDNKDYEKYCRIMIKIMDNTLKELNNK